MAIEIKVAGVTAKMVEPPMLAAVAVIVVWPVAKPAASPFALTFATDANVEVHVADAVRSSVLPSAYVPVAANCWLVPSAMEGVTGVTATETSKVELTLTVAEALMAPRLAEIVVEPPLNPVANPALLIAAIDG